MVFQEPAVQANPQGGAAVQGTAAFTSQGPNLTVRTSDRAFINWQSFNIGLGQTTTFVQPSSSSLVWNKINDSNPSQILGNLKANGYVVLQNQAGFYVGGQASITTHGLMMTTAPIPMPELSSGAAWQFSAPPPTARIINYGQIQAGQGSSIFLLSHAIENHGSISAPEGRIGLYAGKDVLVSESPDGRGLSASVKLPAGSVDNTGRLIADAGAIAMHAQVVNQGGLLQANSIRERNGVIELLASDALTLGPGSRIEARGAAEGISPGGSVLAKSSGRFSDAPTSSIDVTGGAQGGDGGAIEVSANRMNAIRSRLEGHATAGFQGGELYIDPENIILTDSGEGFPADGTVLPVDPPADTLVLDVNSLPLGLSHVRLEAHNDIELWTVWNLVDSEDPTASLSLEAGRNIAFQDGAGILAGSNWSVSLAAGTKLGSALNRRPGEHGVYLQGNSYIQTQNGNVVVTAGNEVLVDDGINSGLDVSVNGITTRAGGSINVTARFGDITTGGNPNGYDFGLPAVPYYAVSPLLGGISTAAGGDVTLTAGRHITSFFPRSGDLNALYDGGAGAFGSEPGDVTITAGGSVYGHYVVANGMGRVTALTGDVGGALTTAVRLGFALSLIKGDWAVNAVQGSVYLQEVRNPNGIFNNAGDILSNPGWHLFDYDPRSSVTLTAGKSVQLTGRALPRTIDPVQILLPPSLHVVAEAGVPVLDPQDSAKTIGSGGFVLRASMTLFPSPYSDLSIATLGGGDILGVPDFIGGYPTLSMSDSARKQWVSPSNFGSADHAVPAPQLNEWDPAHPNAVEVVSSGNLKTLNLVSAKPAQVFVAGDMINAGFFGQNFGSVDSTSITVAGKIFNQPFYSFVRLDQAIQPVGPLYPAWDSIFLLLVNPATVASTEVPQNLLPRDLRALATQMALFPSSGPNDNPNPGFVYDPATLRFGFAGFMPSSVRSSLQGALQILRYGLDGLPIVANGRFVTDQVSFVPQTVIEGLYQQSQAVPRTPLLGLNLGGAGHFNIQADSINLGSSDGIQSWGIGGRYRGLSGIVDLGAAVNVTVRGDLDMVTSRIASFFGGDVTVVSTEGAMDLGAQGLRGSSLPAFGIFTSGHSDVRVVAAQDVNINGSRIAAYNGGDVFVKSLEGDVNAGTGGNTLVNVPLVFAETPEGEPSPDVSTPIYGSGIVTTSLIKKYQSAGGGGGALPGNITIETPRGDIISSRAGILQVALDGNLASGPTVTLIAGTPGSKGPPPVPAIKGNIDLGDSGLIGGTIHATAEGDIRGVIVSRQSSTIKAAQNFNGTLVAAGTANVNAGGTVAGTIVGIGGIAASGGNVSASLLSQNVSVGGGQAQSTLGTSAAATSTSQSAAQQASTDAKPKEAGTEEEEDPAKKAAKPALARRVGRVTVILPKG